MELAEIDETREYITETDFDEYNKWEINVLGAAGLKYLEGGDWNPVDDHSEFGVLIDVGRKEWPLRLSLDYLLSSDSESENGTEFDLETSELHIGLRYVIDIPDSMFTIYTGAGVALVDIELDATTGFVSLAEDESSIGGYIGWGSYLRWTDNFLTGFDLRFTEARLDLENASNLNAGGWHVLLTAGFRF